MKTIRDARPNEQGGFTLMEVMLAVLIMSALMTAMSQILTNARSTRDMIYNLRENQLAGPAILDLLENDLRGLTTFNRGRRQVLRIRDRSLRGLDADSIDFVCLHDSNVITEDESQDRYVRADINEVGYHLRPNADDDDFLELFRREGFGIDEEPFAGGRYTFLHERIRGLNIEVFDEDGPEAEPLESWNEEEGADQVGLPKRIEITLELEFAPRITREQLKHVSVDKRRVTYKRVIRFPEMLHVALQVQPIPVIPNVQPPAVDTGAGSGSGLVDPNDPNLGGDINTTTLSGTGLDVNIGGGGAGDPGAVLDGLGIGGG